MRGKRGHYSGILTASLGELCPEFFGDYFRRHRFAKPASQVRISEFFQQESRNRKTLMVPTVAIGG
ncbi:hypothetical protein L0244_14615 [bacterium]|nr:hypothetical protein [bacterium]MCI0614216.1 hypothetical protein [bacterium]